MPELPEVETVRTVLEGVIPGKTIKAVMFHKNRLFRTHSPVSLKKKIINRKINSVERRAKFLLIRLDRGLLLVHLGMSGQVLLSDRSRKTDHCFVPDKHTHLILTLSQEVVVYYRDPRMFGRIDYLDDKGFNSQFAGYGPEPLSKAFNQDYLQKALQQRKSSIKAVLLNQKIAPGMGNIYTDEALFLSAIHPERRASSLSGDEINRLVKAVKQVLRAGIKAKGTSISDYCDPDQNRGQFQMQLNVYGRAGEPCHVCKSPILKKVVAQRGTHWCPDCQQGK